MAKPFHHHMRSPLKRGIFSFLMVFAVMVLGTYGMHYYEKMSYIDAFYFMSMIATAQGSAYTPATFAGKLFASFMAFVSVGAVITALAFLFGPFFGQLWHIGARKLENEISHLSHHDDRK